MPSARRQHEAVLARGGELERVSIHFGIVERRMIDRRVQFFRAVAAARLIERHGLDIAGRLYRLQYRGLRFFDRDHRYRHLNRRRDRCLGLVSDGYCG